LIWSKHAYSKEKERTHHQITIPSPNPTWVSKHQNSFTNEVDQH